MMATGYTYPVTRGEITTLKDYALSCARAFGALVHMRDMPSDAPIPDEVPASTKFYNDKLAETEKFLINLPNLDAEAAAAADYEVRLKSHEEYVASEAESMQRCKDMLAQVEAWETDAEGIKDFMLEQLHLTIGEGHSYNPPPPTRLTGAEWLESQRVRALEDIAYCTRQRDEELARTADRNRWLKALRESLA